MNSITVSGVVSSGVTTRLSSKGKSVSNFELEEKGNRHLVAAWEHLSDMIKDIPIGSYLVISGRLLYSKDSSGRDFANVVASYIEEVKMPESVKWNIGSEDIEEPLVIKTATKKGDY